MIQAQRFRNFLAELSDLVCLAANDLDKAGTVLWNTGADDICKWKPEFAKPHGRASNL